MPGLEDNAVFHLKQAPAFESALQIEQFTIRFLCQEIAMILSLFSEPFLLLQQPQTPPYIGYPVQSVSYTVRHHPELPLPLLTPWLLPTIRED